MNLSFISSSPQAFWNIHICNFSIKIMQYEISSKVNMTYLVKYRETKKFKALKEELEDGEIKYNSVRIQMIRGEKNDGLSPQCYTKSRIIFHPMDLYRNFSQQKSFPSRWVLCGLFIVFVMYNQMGRKSTSSEPLVGVCQREYTSAGCWDESSANASVFLAQEERAGWQTTSAMK